MTTYEQLDRTIYEHIRRELVTAGVLPDRKLLTAKQYAIAKQALKTAGNLIDVFGSGSSEARDRKEVDRITILRKNTQRGSLGSKGVFYFEAQKDVDDNIVGYTKTKPPTGNKNVIYEIRIIAVTAKSERIMITAVNDALGYGDYINIVDPITLEGIEDKMEFLAIAGDVDVSTTDFMERLITYQFTEVWVDASKVISTTVKPILEVHWNNTFPEGTPSDNENAV